MGLRYRGLAAMSFLPIFMIYSEGIRLPCMLENWCYSHSVLILTLPWLGYVLLTQVN